MLFVQNHVEGIAFSLILTLAGLLRLTGRNWDEGQYLHPDERFITMVATALRWPGVGGYFDSTNSTLNPYNMGYGSFIYGTVPLFLGKLWGSITGYVVYGDYHLASRSLSAIFDLITVVLVFLIARKLFSPTIGLLAMLLYSLSVLAIQLSHFGTFDLIATTFCVATFWFALKANEDGRWWNFLLSGLMAGLAIASKLSALPIIAVCALPLVEQIRLHGIEASWRRPAKNGLPAFLGVAVALVAALWTFRIGQPYAFLGPSPFSFRFDPRWQNDVSYWRLVQSGEADMPPSVQWANRTPLVFTVRNLVQWGLGPALGIASLLGLALGGVRILTYRKFPPAWLLVLVGWPAFHIVYYGISFIKTMRYVVPAYPFLAILAAAFLVLLAGWLRPRLGRIQWLAYAPIAVVIAMTAFWALSFTTIYTRPVTRMAATEWIYANVPSGSAVLTEHWDDGLPLSLPGYPSPADYPGQQIPNYNLDDATKLSDIMGLLEGADYLFLTSNRLYGSIPQIPERYPMTIEYYRMLFAGELGFELKETFTSRPQLFGIELNDDNAEEAFTVYDHPKVYLFQKSDSFNSDAIATHLATFLDQDIADVRSANAGYNMLKMDDAERITQQSGGTWSAMFDRNSVTNQFPAIAWYLALQLMALAAVPFLWRLLPRMPDRGYALAKGVGLLMAAFVAWFLASLHLVTFGRGAVVLGILASLLFSIVAIGRNPKAFVDDLRERWRWIAAVEVVFLLAFVAFTIIRYLNPDLWHPARGGEKPMEFAYFNAILRSSHFPPFDPWFAGGYINYYYFGYVIMASITRLTGVVPEVAFNLAVVTCFSLAVVLSWSFVASSLHFLRRQTGISSGLKLFLLATLGPLLLAVMGNLDMSRRIGLGEMGYPPVPDSGRLSLGSFGDIVRGLWRAVSDPRQLPTDAFWTPTRLIDGTINEFPYFSFLFADLHAHMMAIPFALTALLLALGILSSRAWKPLDPMEAMPTDDWMPRDLKLTSWLRQIPSAQVGERAGLTLLAGLVVGVLYPLNTWDYPTYLVVTFLAFFLLEFLGSVASSWQLGYLQWDIGWSTARRAAIQAVGVLLIGRFLFFPYFRNSQSQSSGFQPWLDQSPTNLYLIHFGGLLFLLVMLCLTDLWTGPGGVSRIAVRLPTGFSWSGGSSQPGTGAAQIAFADYDVHRIVPTIAIAGAAALGTVALVTHQIVLLFAALILLIGTTAWFRRHDSLRLFLLGLAGLGVLITAFVEFYTLKGDIGRMNTVFKFNLQVWTMLALVAAVGIVLTFASALKGSSRLNKAPWMILAVVLIGAGLVYPALATPARIDDRFGATPRTLDGMAYMEGAVFFDGAEPGIPAEMDLSQDLQAINWLRDNVQGSPVILEAVTPLYRWGSRYSVYTGLPTVIGWDWHQTQQRPGLQSLIDERKEAVATIYNSDGSFTSVRRLLDDYHVRYVIVGPLERAFYAPAGLAKFDEAVADGNLDLVYDENGVRIYGYGEAMTG